MREQATLAKSFDAQSVSYVTQSDFSSTYIQRLPLDHILRPHISSKQFRVHWQSVLDKYEYIQLCINETHTGTGE